MATMPNVVGLGIAQATTALIQAGVAPDNGLLPTGSFVNIGYFDNWPVKINWVTGTDHGIVSSQSPSAGSTVANAGTLVPFAKPTVTLTVSAFPMGVADRYSSGAYS